MVAPLLLVLAGCAEDTAESVSPEEAVRRLARVSLDLRGVRPTEAEIAAVEADPAALEDLTAEFVTDERFFDHLVQLYQEVYLTETEGIDLRPSNVPFEDAKPYYWLVGQEPLQIVGQLAREDLPYTELVTGDWTMAEEYLGTTFPVEWPEGQTGWHKTRYLDGRPAVGVLAANGLWWRYTTTEANANRRRANAISSILVCHNYLDRPILFAADIPLTDDAAVRDAVTNDPTCVGCHSSLDPIAASLFGFYWSNFTSATEGLTYHEEKETMWGSLLGVSPGWAGESLSGLTELGPAIAADARFVPCAVDQAWSLMLRRKVSPADQPSIQTLTDDFVAGGLKLRQLYRDIALHPTFLGLDEGEKDLRLLRPDAIGASVEDLTGFDWQVEGLPVLQSDVKGLRGLAGGVEGILIKQPALRPSSSILLVSELLAAEASAYAVATEADLPAADRRLFTEIDFTETFDDDEPLLREQAQLLYVRVLSRRVAVDGPEVDATMDLWRSLYELEESPSAAWRGVLDALLRDPTFLLY
jgi:hypothetical protein